MQNYETLHEIIEKNVGWDVPFYKLKFIYENKKWQQVTPDYDLFNDFEHVNALCSSGQVANDLICTADYSFWSVMKQFKPTEDIYQFIDYATQSFKTSIHDFHFNFDHILNFIDVIGEVLFV